MRETITSAAPSATFNATQDTSDCFIEGDFNGVVSLQIKHPSSSEWFNRVVVSSRTSAPIVTPSAEADYRFSFSGTGSAIVSFSPTA